MLPACLVDDPPPFAEAHQTPPRLNARDAQPLLNQILVARTGDLLTFRVPVTSEDAGEDLAAQLLLDDVPYPLNYQTLPASTLDALDREFAIEWRVLVSAPGCHRFTVRAGHSHTLPGGNSQPLNTADLAEIYWWANIDTDAETSDVLVGCPGPVVGMP